MSEKKKSKAKNKHKKDSSSEEDDIFFYRYCGLSTTQSQSELQTQSKPNNNTGSGSLAPSKSTLYVSNLDYSLTNSDLHTLFSTVGKIARVTVLKDRHTRLSRGVAFVQFVSRDDARQAAELFNGKILNGRTLTASIAADNGRAPEFIRKRVYRDNGRCFECGVSGHLSYDCPKNQLGSRARPPPKLPRKGFRRSVENDDEADEGSDGRTERFEDDNWASVVDDGADERLLSRNDSVAVAKKDKKGKKAGYFSDESDHDDDD